MDEMFDVFEGNADPASASEDERAPIKHRKDKTKKRKADEAMNGKAAVAAQKENTTEDTEMGETSDAASKDGEAVKEDDSDTPSQQDKKRRKKGDGAVPVMTDSFETAESREVAGAQTFVPQDSSLILSHNIQHQVALPPDLDYEYVPLSEHKSPAEPARTYPFKLDPFQSLSVASIERDESVLVSAHTSAGKTVVAEYALAQCLKRNQRIIYTSPIKALSNQKYRDFEAEFGDVGLMTGDVTINPTASCLVMTTEILRSMLYRGSEIMREVAWVVYDEIHYMRDKTRGVVWEETIIMLPDKVRYVFLSATIPNAFQFAEWIAKIHHQACHVVYTDFRPTPLQNYFYPAGGSGARIVVDEKGNFNEDNFNIVMKEVEEKKGADPNDINAKQTGKGKKKKTHKGGAGADEGSDMSRIIRMTIRKSFNPVIVFNFSKRECENMAISISKMSLNDDSEKALVKGVFNNAIGSLSEQDRDLPQIKNLLPLLMRGIGVHHSGLLPILKETIEILFQETLIKVLFATETFSIGLNMPAKTVVFTQVTKWDGVKRRPLTCSEYVQMAGRAGRRGLDARGIVIMMIDDKLEPDTAKEIVTGQQDRLNSAFYLGYNMILNLLRIEAISPEFMLERCFHQFQNAASVPTLERELMALQQERDGATIADEATIKDYYQIRQQLNAYTRDMRSVIQLPNYSLDFLQPGRLVQIYNPKESPDNVAGGLDFGWGVIVNHYPRRSPKLGEPEHIPQESYIIDVLLTISASSADIVPGQPAAEMPTGLVPANGDQTTINVVVPCLLTCIKAISQIRLFMPKEGLKADKDRETVNKSLAEVKRRFPDGLPILDPLENMDITDESFKKLLRKIEVLESRLLANPLHLSPLLPSLWDQYHAKTVLSEKIKTKKKSIAKAHSIAQMDELKSRKRVLRRLGFINDGEVVQLKARVACEISSTEGHELVLSELLFDRFFNEMSPETCAAVLSCFIFDEKVEATALKEDLQKPYREVQAKARIVAKVSQECKLDVNEDEYATSLKWQLMETVYAWAQGRPFSEICKMTNVYEGSLIRLFRRLEELLRQMAQAAKVMGNDDLTKKFDESLQKVRRDIVAAQSLYL
ncbi:ATP-dependent RNA helicase DOB1 [Cordyceps fumosorosea ARSEF 2679]|uniref:ATP-dependent RNA helicase DOB1 n=1 Tax=Cordyceps fumosorosea (strain ARSEF 2679) TaxID=1081104 RepID=A0A168BAD8_CORFA|nr:ATP-dependent RNA helicase DOB1 [Cordyceps fumosorosea ARSEF 2679]OAA69845.1 ATP-dependent RNA helicase DOB1 [Cordyceps fumosorosea ARSEF 2679]